MTSRADLNVGYKIKIIITSVDSRILIVNKLDEGKEIELISISAQQRSSHFYIASNLAGSSDLCVFCFAPVLLNLGINIFLTSISFLRIRKVTQLYEVEQATPRGRK
jgi:hypothetical protein